MTSRTFRGTGPLVAFFVSLALASGARAQKLSEFVAHHAGALDDHEYVEIFGSPVTSYPTHRVLVVDGSVAGGPGRVASVFTVGTTNGAGFWTTGFLTAQIESTTFTLLLVDGFSGNVGDDLDTNDDGSLDAAPWSVLRDSVAVTDGDAGARVYSTAVLAPSFDGVGTPVAGASRFPYFRDTDAASDWKRNDFDGAGLPGFTGSLAPGEALNTPGWPTQVTLEDYYAGVDASTSAALRGTLHAAIRDHVRYPYTASSTDTWDILNLADEDPTDATKVWDIYRNERYTKIPGGTGPYNREHSWPNSLGFPIDTMVPYTDAHHLFVSEVQWNQDRGNKPYGNCPVGCSERATVANYGFGGGSGVYPGNSNWVSGSVWETWNHRRGDVARAQLYLDVRYAGEYHAVTNAFEPDLVLTDNASLIVGKTATPASPVAYMGLLTDLIRWSVEDLPDDRERHRNDVVVGFQGNRNPFVDHPEWVQCVFLGTGCATSSATSFYTLDPCRILDTRDPDGPLGGPALAAGADRAFTLSGACGIPATARALSVNVTVTGPTAGGYLTLHPGDAAAASTSTINFTAGKTRANNAVLALSGDGAGTVKVLNGSAGTAHVILDVNGYFQ